MTIEDGSFTGEVDVPFVSSSDIVITKMLEIVELKPGDILFDLGCGDGKVLIAAGQNFGARCIGVERRRELATESARKVKNQYLSKRVAVIFGDFFSLDLRNADVIVSYLLTAVNKQLEAKLETELGPRSRVVSHDFEFPSWKPTKFTSLREGWLDHKIFLYVKENQTGFRKKKQVPEPGWRPL